MMGEKMLTNMEKAEKGFKEENSFIREILEEFYDPEAKQPSEEEIKYILLEYGDRSSMLDVLDKKELNYVIDTAESVFDIEAIVQEYYDPSVTPLSEEEMMELFLKYGYDTIMVDNENAKEAVEHDDSEVVVEDGKDGRKKSRNRTRGIRRGGRKDKKTDTEDIRVLHMNCDGYTSKKECIEDIVNERQTDVLLLNETNLKGKRKVRMKKYFSFCKNRVKAKGGVATIIANHLKQNTVKVAEGREGDEYIITRLDHVVPPVNIVNIYGQQESRTPKERILESLMSLREDLVRVESNGEAALIIGDMNRTVGSDKRCSY